MSKKKFTKPSRDGSVSYIEEEVVQFNFKGFDVVLQEWFSKGNCPAITLKHDTIVLNLCGIKKLDKCSHILILMNSAQKKMIAKPCEEDDNNSLQCSRIDKHGKLTPKTMKGKFTMRLYKDMNWNSECTYKVLGRLQKRLNKETGMIEKLFVFELINAEAYSSVSQPTVDDPKRRIRVEYMPEHWKNSFGPSYEENQKPLLETFEDIPEHDVTITFPKLPFKFPADDKTNDKEAKQDGNT
jgi:hypothetical protein